MVISGINFPIKNIFYLKKKGVNTMDFLEWFSKHFMIEDNNSPATGFWNGCVFVVFMWLVIGAVIGLAYLLFF